MIFGFIRFLLIYSIGFCYAIDGNERNTNSNNDIDALQDTNDYDTCVTGTNQTGYCLKSGSCPIPENGKSFQTILNNLCIIKQKSIGVCCPFTETGIFKGLQIEIEKNYVDSNMGKQNRGCGTSTKQILKIMGGRFSEPGQWPWMAAIMKKGRRYIHCGGSLITSQHILTAAHCTSKYNKIDFYIILGEYNLETINETRSREFSIAELNEHKDFDPATYLHDIAVIKLDRPTVFNTYIWPVCIAPLKENWSGWAGVIIGWGSKFFGGPYSNILMQTSVPIWEHKKCQEHFVEYIPETCLCAGDENGGKDSCQGDSGGPLLVQLPNKRWSIIGIVSWGLRCGEPNNPGIYTKVNEYLDWILANTIY